MASPYTRGTVNAWRGMKERCDNPNHVGYAYYGAKGISYDPRWKRYSAFLADMGECPEGLSLDRIDNTGSYCKENCRWATWSQQMLNRSARGPSGQRGVHWYSRGQYWIATININGRKVRLGYSTELKEAVEMRLKAEEGLRLKGLL